MSRSILAAAATIGLAAFVPHLPAMAQDNSPAITVRAPAIDNRGQPKYGVHPPMQLVSNVIVETGDLDLRTAYGRAVLDARVRLAADQACDRLDDIEPSTGVGPLTPDSGDCRHLAMKSAERQVRFAIALAGGRSSQLAFAD
jgi:UrcA family protein